MKKFLEWLLIGLVILAVTMSVLLVLNEILPTGWEMTPEILLGVSAIVLSLVFTYLPKLRLKFAVLTPTHKALVNLVAVVILAVAMYLGVCVGLYVIPGVVCTVTGIRALAIYVIIAVGANQLTYVPSVKPSDVIEAQEQHLSEW